MLTKDRGAVHKWLDSHLPLKTDRVDAGDDEVGVIAGPSAFEGRPRGLYPLAKELWGRFLDKPVPTLRGIGSG